ncbi:MAG: 4-(cytidine 5'-diphospho)-2-C-methyl-D-erythritol kinase [Treponema sp.]|nr:4-(cytidine 5'-diphospho)-2-C-methyl-D-erythritol kinase [Treponema sp.]
MLRSLTVQAPAKINLGLRVFPMRADGYHEIESIFTTVNLCDTITVQVLDQKDVCKVDCEGMVLPEENTFTKAYKAFCVLTGIRDGVHVHVTKRIPAGGGLGGGSSDSSSFIKSIDTLFGTQLSDSALLDIAGQVGSDVYFFTRRLVEKSKVKSEETGFSAIVRGRGEIIKPIENRNDFSVLLVFPGVHVSTKDAYALVDASLPLNIGNRHSDCELECLYNKPIREWFFSNDFTAPVAGKHPRIRQAVEDLKKVGSDFADMSGSGSTVFAVFEDRDKAEFAYRKLAMQWDTLLL